MNKPAKKIVVIGSASTGKSTLSAMLAGALHTLWVPEYARAYLETLGRDYTYGDLQHIAAGQMAAEDKLLQQATDLLICDTDLYVIKVWSEHVYGKCCTQVLQAIADRSYDMYVLTDIDIPWEDDPLRETAEREMRDYFYAQYRDIVINSGVPWVLVSGTPDQRLQTALVAIKNLL